ncbi:MAG: extracellular solute-binding protein family 1 [Paenibacillaceae bacterium]|jgi:putative aldouronate transport system substrate-binding protein|nr:extracellular solute-binding protein family 1 [Paenibacillaceae bacterium]
MKQARRVVGKIIPAVLAVAMVLAVAPGCAKEDTAASTLPAVHSPGGEGTGGKTLPEVQLIWYLRGSKPKNAEAVVAKANEITKAKINATVEYRFVEPGDYDQKLQLAMASGEAYDIAWTSNWSNNYVENVNKGAYLALDDYLPQFPKLQQALPQLVWNAVKVKEKIYGVYNYQILSLPMGFMFKKDLVDKYKLDVSHITKLSDLTPIFEKIRQGEPDVVPVKFGVPNLAQIMEQGTVNLIEDFVVDTSSWKITGYRWTKEDMMPHYRLMREWYTKGFFPSNVSTASEGDQALAKAGRLFSEYSGYKPGVEAEQQAKLGYEVIVKALTKPGRIRTLYSTLSAISKNSKNPERALMLLELVNTDKELYNLLTFGIEGQDYRKTGANRIEKIPDTYQFEAWELGNQFNAYLLEGQDENTWQETIRLNDTVELDELADFVFDRKPVQNELVQISAIFKEFNPILKNGLDEPEAAVKRFSDKLKQAGADKVQQEIQKQLDEWRSGK